MWWAPLVVLVAPLGQTDGAAVTRIAVPDMRLAGPIEESLGQTMIEVVVTEASKVGGAEVIGASDIKALLGFEEQKQLLGCTEVACIAEIGGALGADLLLVSDLGLVEGTWSLNLKLVETAGASVRGRVNRTLQGSAARVLTVLEDATRELLASVAVPVAEPPSSWPIWTLVGVGGAALATGMVLEILAAGEDSKAHESLEVGDVALGFGGYDVHGPEAREHFDSAQQLSRAALGVAAGGVVLAAAGLTWMLLRGDPEPQLTIAPAVGPESGGVMLRGDW